MRSFKKPFFKLFLFMTLFAVGIYIFAYGINKKELYNMNNGDAVAFAHRGIRNYYIENSEESFLYAKKLNFTALEIDISLTKDQVPIVFHDDNCQRLLGIDTNIFDVNYSFIKYKHLIYKGKNSKNTILTLNDFLERLQKENIIYLDIKTPTKQLADSLLFFIERSQKYETTLIADDNIFFLGYLKYKNPEIRTILEGFNKGKEFLFYIIPHKYRPDFYASFLSEVDENHMAFLKNNNLVKQKIVYGVEQKNLQQVLDYGLQNVIIDYDSSMLNADNITKTLMKKNHNN